MVNINEEFPSKYLKAADLKGHVAKVQIAHVDRETISNDARLVMYFRGKDKGMVLNKTNARTIGDVYGDDTDNWTGAEIEVFSMKVDFQGRMVDGLRIRVPPPPRQAAANRAPTTRHAGIDYVGNARDDARMQAGLPDERPGQPHPPGSAPAPFDEDVGDSIPF